PSNYGIVTKPPIGPGIGPFPTTWLPAGPILPRWRPSRTAAKYPRRTPDGRPGLGRSSGCQDWCFSIRDSSAEISPWEKQHEEGRVTEGEFSLSAERREDQGAGRLAGQDALPAPHIDQASRPRGRRGVEVERGSGVVSRRIDLHRRDLQERREDDLLQGGCARGPSRPLQREPRWQHQACHRLP